MRRQRPNNNAARSRKGQPQNRKQAISTQNERVLTRKFILNERVGLNTSLGTNTILDRTLQWNGAELQGFNAISAGFDQYRIRRIQLFITPCATQITQIQIASSLAKQPIYSCASTTVYSAVDLTGGPNPGADILAFQNCEFRTPDPHSVVKLADFEPRIENTSGLLYTTNTWLSTSNTSQLWNSIHLRFINSNGTFVFTNPADPQEFNLRSVVHVEFRHPIYDVQTLLPDLPLLPHPFHRAMKPANSHKGET